MTLIRFIMLTIAAVVELTKPLGQISSNFRVVGSNCAGVEIPLSLFRSFALGFRVVAGGGESFAGGGGKFGLVGFFRSLSIRNQIAL